MNYFFAKTLILGFSIFIIGRYTRLFKIDGLGTALIAGLLLGAINAVIRPVLFLLTLPLTILTLGLFIFFLNGFCFMLTGWLVPGFKSRGCLTSTLAWILISLVSLLLNWLFI